jgi:hypothetical protein
MPQYISQNEWDAYKQVINNFHEDSFQEDILWIKSNEHWVTAHGEDDGTQPEPTEINLKGLIQYNDYRSWPTTNPTRSGERDLQNLLVFFNTEYLVTEGHTNPDRFLDFDPGHDRFVIRGKKYKAMGESHTAQASGSPLLQFIILEREETPTHSDIY